MRLQNKICVITGAGSGIGEAAGRLFAREGAQVVLLDIDEASGTRVAAEIGDPATFIATDVSDPDSVATAFQEIHKQFGRLDGLYNNASVFWGKHDAAVTELDLDIYHRIVAINQHSVVYCTKHAIPMMINSGGGAVVNTASSAAVIGVPGSDSYTASKGATLSLTRSLAVEYGPKKVRINCVAPAAIATPMLRESNLDDPDFDEQAFLDKTPVRRWGQPEEIAQVAMFLISNESAYVNGAIVVADGGITITPIAV